MQGPAPKAPPVTLRRAREIRRAIRRHEQVAERITMQKVMTLPGEELQKLQDARPHDAERFTRAIEKRKRKER